MRKPLYRCMTKGLADEQPGQIIRSQKWIASRRGSLEFFDDRVKCGDWDVPFSIANEVVLYKGWQFPFPLKVLEIVVAGKAYQFGINGWCRVEPFLPDGYRTEKLRMRLSPFSIATRVVVIGILVYWIWEKLAQTV